MGLCGYSLRPSTVSSSIILENKTVITTALPYNEKYKLPNHQSASFWDTRFPSGESFQSVMYHSMKPLVSLLLPEKIYKYNYNFNNDWTNFSIKLHLNLSTQALLTPESLNPYKWKGGRNERSLRTENFSNFGYTVFMSSYPLLINIWKCHTRKQTSHWI